MRNEPVEEAQGARPVRRVVEPPVLRREHLARHGVHAERPRRVVGVARLHVARERVGDVDRRLEVAPLAGDLVEGHELGAEGARLVGLQEALAGDHVAVVAAGVDVGVVGEGQVRPRGVLAGEAVVDPVVGHAAACRPPPPGRRGTVQQVPRGEGHRDLVAAEAARVVLGLPHLVLEHVRHAVRARAQLLPEAPDQAHHAVEGSGRVVVGPRQDHPVGVGPDLVVLQVRARGVGTARLDDAGAGRGRGPGGRAGAGTTGAASRTTVAKADSMRGSSDRSLRGTLTPRAAVRQEPGVPVRPAWRRTLAGGAPAHGSGSGL